MRIIAIGDIHMAAGEARRIPGIGDADLVILNGDLTNCGGARDAKAVLDAIFALNRNVLCQFGNMDRPEVNEYLESQNINLHGQARLVDGKACLAGVGGSNPTPFRTPSEFAEQELLRLAEQAMEQGLQHKRNAEIHGECIPLILVCHAPPLNTRLDTLRNGKHVGSSSIRAIIEKYRPDLCISGHIHEAKGRDTLAGIPLCNPGPLRGGNWLGLTINSSRLDIDLQ